jgi:DNA modification methylase
MSDHEIVQGDCLEVLRSLDADSVDLVMTSPPYEDRRTYGIDFSRAGEDWVGWMVEVVRELSRVCKGLIAIVCQGKTDDFRWSAAPALLMADLHRAGFNLRNPLIFHRVGIPGSGGPDWMRADHEFIICVTRQGKLPWSDNTVMGHPPKWAPGGEMSHRLSNGDRRNKFGVRTDVAIGARSYGRKNKRENYRAKPAAANEFQMIADAQDAAEQSKACLITTTSGDKDGDNAVIQKTYNPPVLANPGSVLHFSVGGGRMGDKASHLNEAPYPEDLCQFFILSFCPPGGLVCDPFSGSGTTCCVSKRWGRRSLGIDIRESQVEIAWKRLGHVTPMMFV